MIARRFLLARAAGLALLALLPAASWAQSAVDLSRKAVLEDPVAPKWSRPGYDVTIVEFADYNCGYCHRLQPTLNALMQSDRKVRMVYRDWPIFGADSREIARYAIASQWQGRHAAFHNALMTTSGHLNAAQVRAVATRANVDWARLNRDLALHGEEIDALLARTSAIVGAIGGNGTPLLIVGSQIVPGAIDLPTLRQLVKAARAKPAGG